MVHVIINRWSVLILIFTLLTLLAVIRDIASAGGPASPRIIVAESGDTCDLANVNEPVPEVGLAMFTRDFGPSTLTLPPITEVTVRNGKVETISWNGDSAIPGDGYVLASFGTWLSDNLSVGDRVRVDLRPGIEQGWTVSRRIDGINVVRNTDFLVVYTPKSRKTTGTNEYGTEAVISGGTIIAAGGNNSPVPRDGFVVSGHGAAQEWLQENMKPGFRAELAGNMLTVTADVRSYVSQARNIADELSARSKISDMAMSAAVNCDGIVSSAETALKAGDNRLALELALKAVDMGKTALTFASPSASPEFRGFWHRANETTPEEIRTTLDRLAKANVNAVFLEVFYGGRTMYPSDLTEQLPQFWGWDPLAEWVKEAHDRHIQVHAWMHIANVGEGEPGPILEAHPEWAALQKNGETEASAEPGLYFGDLAHPGFRDFISRLLDEAMSRYPLDGVELDYIRYPGGEGDASFSYGDYIRKAFAGERGTDPAALNPGDALWKAWEDWRRNAVTDFVRRIRREMKERHSDVLLSAAVGPDPVYARTSLMQDWSRWLAEGLLDFVSPMLYSQDTQWVIQKARKASDEGGKNVRAVSGLGPFVGLSSKETADQIKGLRDAGNDGALLFSLWYARGGLLRVLQAGPWNERVDPPLGKKW